MTAAQSELLKLIHDTKAVSIWNHKTGPVFWYAASVPGPFYVNTELVIGPELAEMLLSKITAIIADTADLASRAEQLNNLILSAYAEHANFRKVIAALVDTTKTEFPPGSYDVISGGERRDWLFSIPLAHELKLRHVFLFKNQQTYCKDPVAQAEHALHVSDLINNAASYFDAWFPILEKAKLNYIGTICINSRGDKGVNRLKEHGKKVVSLNSIDVSFFEKSQASGLIDQDTLTEISTYFQSPQKWASAYLMGHPHLFDTPHIDKKSFERMQSFFGNDPWSLRSEYTDFFVQMQNEIAQRSK